jgi:hypothetical protein
MNQNRVGRFSQILSTIQCLLGQNRIRRDGSNRITNAVVFDAGVCASRAVMPSCCYIAVGNAIRLDMFDALPRCGLLTQTLTIAADPVGLPPRLSPARWYHELELTDTSAREHHRDRALRSSVVDHGAHLEVIHGFDNWPKTIVIPMRDFKLFDTQAIDNIGLCHFSRAHHRQSAFGSVT